MIPNLPAAALPSLTASPIPPRTPSRRRPRARRRVMTLIVIVLLGATAFGAWLLRPKSSTGVVVPKVPVLELAASDTLLVEARELQVRLPVSGSLQALRQATVKSKVAGEVRETPVAEGMPVRRGQIVVRLDTADLNARLATQLAAQDDARARLMLARKNHANNLALMQQKFISQNAVDTAQNTVELAEATVKSADSQLDIARRAVDDALVRAPIDGIISKRFVQPGEKATADMALFSIVNLAHLILEAQVPASDIPKVVNGQQVDFTVEGFAGRAFSGHVVRINPATEAGSRAIIVYVAVDNADGALKSGMFAKGSITLQKAAPLPVLPVAALHQQNGVPMVWRIENNRVVAQPVMLGLRNEDEGLVQVTQGLSAGSRVLVAPLDNVRVGSQVRLPAAASVPPGAGRAPVSAPGSSSVKG